MMMMMMTIIIIMTIESVEQRPGWGEHLSSGPRARVLGYLNVLRGARACGPKETKWHWLSKVISPLSIAYIPKSEG